MQPPVKSGSRRSLSAASASVPWPRMPLSSNCLACSDCNACSIFSISSWSNAKRLSGTSTNPCWCSPDLMTWWSCETVGLLMLPSPSDLEIVMWFVSSLTLLEGTSPFVSAFWSDFLVGVVYTVKLTSVLFSPFSSSTRTTLRVAFSWETENKKCDD